jgi:hypothetical protein
MKCGCGRMYIAHRLVYVAHEILVVIQKFGSFCFHYNKPFSAVQKNNRRLL